MDWILFLGSNKVLMHFAVVSVWHVKLKPWTWPMYTGQHSGQDVLKSVLCLERNAYIWLQDYADRDGNADSVSHLTLCGNQTICVLGVPSRHSQAKWGILNSQALDSVQKSWLSWEDSMPWPKWMGRHISVDDSDQTMVCAPNNGMYMHICSAHIGSA